jgi:ubiquitin thioesterase OTU1
LADFLSLVGEKAGVAVESLDILVGFPPKPLDLHNSGATTVGALGIQAGDSLTVRQASGSATTAAAAAAAAVARTAEAAAGLAHLNSQEVTSPGGGAGGGAFTVAGLSEDKQLARAIAASLGEDIGPLANTSAPPPTATASQNRLAPSATTNNAGPATLSSLATTPKGQPAFEPLSDGTAIVRRIVADDNSCLFSAVGYVAKGGRSAASSLRSIVAQEVLADPFEWSEVVLGKDPTEYAAWITDTRRWGGAIELSILSKYLKKEIAAFDIQTERVDIYGQGEGYSERVMLVYDGLHYDALAVAAGVGTSESRDVVSMNIKNAKMEAVMAGAARLVAKAHASRQFTDTANFTLRCGVCKIGLKGEKEAVMHAQSTGHQNFTEY